MGHIFFGHGGLNPPSPGTYQEGMDVVAIPNGTTLQFYTDFGQALTFDANNFTSLWARLQQPWSPLDHTNVTYNLTLAEYGIEEMLALMTQSVDGYEMHIVGIDESLGKSIQLCEGTPETCPTKPGVPPFTHTCTGILGRFTGSLHWLACTGLIGPTIDDVEVIDGALNGAPWAVKLGQNPDTRNPNLPAEQTATRLINVSRNRIKALGVDSPQLHEFMHRDMTQDEKEILWRDPVLREWYRAHPAATQQPTPQAEPEPEAEAPAPPGDDASWAEWAIYTGQNHSGEELHNWLYPDEGGPTIADIEEMLADTTAAEYVRQDAAWYLQNATEHDFHSWFHGLLSETVRQHLIANEAEIATRAKACPAT